MIKDIVVNLSVGKRASFAGDYAVSVAAAFDAHLAGIAFLYDLIVPGSGAGYIPATVIETQKRDNAAATKTAIDRFAKVIGDIDVADMILSHAADASSDFIVMGGYGHSRLREFVLGGVTRSILRTMTAPVLMSH